VGLALYLWECKNLVWLFEHMLLVECISQLVAPLKLIYFSIHVSDVLVFIVRCKLIDFVFQIFSLFIPEMSAGFTSYNVQIISIYFIWIL
jgi:hypothetical protein